MTTDYERSVFLNYPYELSYEPLVDAILFASLVSGYEPRAAEEDIGGLSNRIDRIVKLIAQCKYGIHDLSLSTRNDCANPRLNMPFELGIFYGAMRFGEGTHKEKEGFIFDDDLHKNNISLSDTAGLDFQTHKGKPILALLITLRFFKARTKLNIVGPAQISALFMEYLKDLPLLCETYQLIPDQLCFRERRGLMIIWLN